MFVLWMFMFCYNCKDWLYYYNISLSINIWKIDVCNIGIRISIDINIIKNLIFVFEFMLSENVLL